jgi:hypothetical protein
MLDDDKELEALEFADGGLTPPPFQFEFAIYCPWATSVQVIIHIGSRNGDGVANHPGDGKHILLDMVRTEGSLWCGEIDLPGKHHLFSYRAMGGERTVVAPFEGGYHAPGTYAKVSARATYKGRGKPGRMSD